MLGNKLSIPLILRDFSFDTEYRELQAQKLLLINLGTHRTMQMYGNKPCYEYSAAFIELNNRLLELEGLKTFGGDQHYRILTEEETNSPYINLEGKTVDGPKE